MATLFDIAAEDVIDAFINDNALHEKGCVYAEATTFVDVVDEATQQKRDDAWCLQYREFQIRVLKRAIEMLEGNPI